jgi:CubicO group peptidase (beta-lactamase class C family)
VDEGRLALDDTLSELLPSYTSAMSPNARRTTLEQLLTMTGGFAAEGSAAEAALIRADDWVAAALRSAEPPGEFAYSNAGAHLLSAVLVDATGTSVLDYARSRLFDPLGIPSRPAAEPLAGPLVAGRGWNRYEGAEFGWPVDRQRRHLGASLLRLRPHDMLRIGQLYLDDGRREGRQVLPADWVAAATSRQVHTGGSGQGEGYGYLWWTEELGGHEAAIAYGYGGQVIALVPELRAVVVVSTELHLDRPPTRGNRGVSRSPLLYLVQWAILRNLAGPSATSG